MKKMSLTKVLSLALGCAALVVGSSSAANADEFCANAGTTFILVPKANTNPQVYSHTVDGVVDVMPLGPCTVHFDLTVTKTANSKRPFDIVGTQTITTADGNSSVTSSVKGYLYAIPANGSFLGINYTLTFTGGTGQLKGAQGKTSLTGFAALASTPLSDDYPVDADLMAPPEGDLTGKACWIMRGSLSFLRK
jgi:hypothetical protein